MKSLIHSLEVLLFRARWILAPLYVGLVLALFLLAYRFAVDFIHLAQVTAKTDAHSFTLGLLALLDITLLANLILIVIFAGYENFISRIDVATESEDRPHWMGNVDYSGLKIKLVGSLVAISMIELLRDFMEADSIVAETEKWRIFIHLTFVVSGLLFAFMDYMADKRHTLQLTAEKR